MAYGDEQLKAMGLYEQKEKIAAAQKKFQTDANKTSANVRASSLAEIKPEYGPPINTGADDVLAKNNDLITSFQGDNDNIQKLIEQLTKTQEEASKRAAEAQKGLIGAIKQRKEATPQKTSQEMYNEALTQYGYTPESIAKVKEWNGQLATYNQQLTDLEARKQQALLNKEQQLQGYTGDILRGEQALIHKQYNLDITAKAAQASLVSQQIQMEKGLWDDAKQTAAQIVEFAIYDQKQKLADLDWAYDTYQDLYNMSTTEEKNAWDKAYTLAKDQLDEAKTNAQKVMDLSLKSMGKAGILPTDTYEQAVGKYNEWQAKQPIIPETQGDYYWDANTGSWKLIGGTTEVDTRPYIQDPNNPNASIPNPNYGKPLTTETTTTTEVDLDPTHYNYDDSKLNYLTLPGSPFQRTALAYEKEAILAFAYASSGKQMSWNEAQQLFAAYIPNILDSNPTKIKKLLSLESAINAIMSTATKESLTQANIAIQKIGQLKDELGISLKGGDTQYETEYNQMFGQTNQTTQGGWLSAIGSFLFGGGK